MLLIALAAFALDTLRRLPQPKALAPSNAPAVVLLTRGGEVFAHRGVLREPPVDVRQLPPYVPQAFVAIEDRRF
ncbi:MAG: hypothetical protein ABIV25_13555, partial [Paracoccaceae bacterium]